MAIHVKSLHGNVNASVGDGRQNNEREEQATKKLHDRKKQWIENEHKGFSILIIREK